MAGNDGSQHPDGEELNLTDEQRAALDRLAELLNDLPSSRRRAFKKYLKGLSNGEEGCKSKNDSSEIGQGDNVADRQPDDEGCDRQGD